MAVVSESVIHFLPPKEHKARLFALFILVLMPVAFGALAVFLGQDANWDLRNYHWYNAYAFLNNRDGIDLLPSQTPAFYNPTLDVPFYLLATHVPAVVAGAVLGGVQGLNFVLLFMLAYAGLIVPNPRHKVIVCALLSLLGMLGGGGIAMLGTTFYDNITSLGLFTSALLIIRYARALIDAPAMRAVPLAILSGVPAGLMMGLKLPSVIFCVGLCGALLFLSGGLTRRLLVCFCFGLGVLAGVAVSLGHWAWFLQTHYGNPLFPYFNEYFKSPFAPLASARDIQFVPIHLKDFVFFPFIFAEYPQRVGEIPWRDWRIPMLYALLPLAVAVRLFFGRSKSSDEALAIPYVARFLLAASVISYFVWLVMFGVYRYAIPLEMIAPLLIVFAVGLLPLRIKTRALIGAVLLLVVAVSVQPGNWYRRTTWLDHFVEVKMPQLGKTSDLMVLMAGFEPYAHVITQFPAAVPIIRIQSNFVSPNEDKGINRLIHERIKAHKGRFMMLIPPWQKPLAQQALSYFHLAIPPRPCESVTDRLFNDMKLDLCPVIRLQE